MYGWVGGWVGERLTFAVPESIALSVKGHPRDQNQVNIGWEERGGGGGGGDGWERGFGYAPFARGVGGDGLWGGEGKHGHVLGGWACDLVGGWVGGLGRGGERRFE